MASRNKQVLETNMQLMLWNIVPCEDTHKAFVQTKVIPPSVIDELKSVNGQHRKNTILLNAVLERNAPLIDVAEALALSGHHWLADRLKNDGIATKHAEQEKDNILQEFPQLELILPKKRDRDKLYEHIVKTAQGISATKSLSGTDIITAREQLILLRQEQREESLKFKELISTKTEQAQEIQKSEQQAKRRDSIKADTTKVVGYLSDVQGYFGLISAIETRLNDANERMVSRLMSKIEEHQAMMEKISARLVHHVKTKIYSNFAATRHTNVFNDKFDQNYRLAENATDLILENCESVSKKAHSFEDLKREVEGALRILLKPLSMDIVNASREVTLAWALEKGKLKKGMVTLMNELENTKKTNEMLLEELKICDMKISVGKFHAAMEAKNKRITELEQDTISLRRDLKRLQKHLIEVPNEAPPKLAAFLARNQKSTQSLLFPNSAPAAKAGSLRDDATQATKRDKKKLKALPSLGDLLKMGTEKEKEKLAGSFAVWKKTSFQPAGSRSNAVSRPQKTCRKTQFQHLTPDQVRLQKKIVASYDPGKPTPGAAVEFCVCKKSSKDVGKDGVNQVLIDLQTKREIAASNTDHAQKQMDGAPPRGSRGKLPSLEGYFDWDLMLRPDQFTTEKKKPYTPSRMYFYHSSKTGRRTVSVDQPTLTGAPGFTIPGLENDKSQEEEKQMGRSNARMQAQERIFARRMSSQLHGPNFLYDTETLESRVDHRGVMVGDASIPNPSDYVSPGTTDKVAEVVESLPDVDSFYKMLPGGISDDGLNLDEDGEQEIESDTDLA